MYTCAPRADFIAFLGLTGGESVTAQPGCTAVLVGRSAGTDGRTDGAVELRSGRLHVGNDGWQQFRHGRVYRHHALHHRVARLGLHDIQDAVHDLVAAGAEKGRAEDFLRVGICDGLQETLGLAALLRPPRPKLLYGDGQLQTASLRHCHVPPGQSADPSDESVCVTRFANEPSPPYIRSGHMHLFHDPACGGFGPKRRNHSSTAAV